MNLKRTCLRELSNLRRLFLVEIDPSVLAADLKERAHDVEEFLITETFIPKDEGKTLIQLLSSSRFMKKESEPDQRWAKAEFKVLSSGWRLEKLSPREDISSEEYYELLLGQPNAAVEQKVRTVFMMNGRRYALEMNGVRNYSVIQVDYHGDETVNVETLFDCLDSVTVVGELFMSLEETFCRLYLKRAQTLENTRVGLI